MTLQDQLSFLEQKGYVFLRGLMSDAEISHAREVIGERLGEALGKHTLEQRNRIKFVLTEKKDTRNLLLQVARRPPLFSIIAKLQSKPFIDHTKALVKMPKAGGTPWHQDANYWQDFDPSFTMYTLWVALSRCGKNEGCMRFIEGTHKNAVHPSSKVNEIDLAIADDIIAGEMEKHAVVDCDLQPGDAVIFHNKLIHSAYENSSNEARIAFKIAFQDKTKRNPGSDFHPTNMEIPTTLEIYGGRFSKKKSLLRRLSEAAEIVGPPLSTSVDLLKKARKKISKPRALTTTQIFKPLRQFQLEGSDREWHQVFFYHELFSKLEGVPGDVAEFGVAGGVSLLCMVRNLRILEQGIDPKFRRTVFGFDSFEGLPELVGQDVVEAQHDLHMKKGGFYDPEGYKDLFAFAEKESNLRLVRGWFNETLPVFLANNKAANFALVHIDCDLYESTKVVLDLIWDRVVPGGIVAFDELYKSDYPGETEAFREFSAGKSFSMHQSRIWPDKKYVVKAA